MLKHNVIKGLLLALASTTTLVSAAEPDIGIDPAAPPIFGGGDAPIFIEIPDCPLTQGSFEDMYGPVRGRDDLGEWQHQVHEELGRQECVGRIGSEMFDVPAGETHIFLPFLQRMTNTRVLNHLRTEVLDGIQPVWCQNYRGSPEWGNFFATIHPELKVWINPGCYPPTQPCPNAWRSFENVYELDEHNLNTFLGHLSRPECVRQITENMFNVTPGSDRRIVKFSSILQRLTGGGGRPATANDLLPGVLGHIQPEWCDVYKNGNAWGRFLHALNPNLRSALPQQCRCFCTSESFTRVYSLTQDEQEMFMESLGLQECAPQITSNMFNVPSEAPQETIFSNILMSLFGGANHASTVSLISPEALRDIQPDWCRVIRGRNEWRRFLGELRDEQRAEVPFECLNTPDILNSLNTNTLVKFRRLLSEIPRLLREFVAALPRWLDELVPRMDMEAFRIAFVEPNACAQITGPVFQRLGEEVHDPDNHPFQSMDHRCLNAILDHFWDGNAGKVEFVNVGAFERLDRLLSNTIYSHMTLDQFGVLQATRANCRHLKAGLIRDECVEVMTYGCLEKVPNDRWVTNPRKVGLINEQEFANVRVKLGSNVYANMTPLQYGIFFDRLDNLAFLDIASAPNHVLGLINSTARLLRIPDGEWDGQNDRIHHVHLDAFIGPFDRILHDDVYAGMIAAQFRVLQANSENCRHLNAELLRNECLQAMTYACLKEVPNNGWADVSPKVRQIREAEFANVDVVLKDRVYKNMTPLQYDTFFGRFNNLYHLSIASATDYAIGKIDTRVKLIAIGIDKWIGQGVRVNLLPATAFSGNFLQPLPNDVYGGMTNDQFVNFVSTPGNCSHLIVGAIRDDAIFYLSSECLQASLLSHPAVNKHFDPGFYQLPDNAGLFKDVKLAQLVNIDHAMDAPSMQQSQIDDIAKWLVLTGNTHTLNQLSVAQSVAHAHGSPLINLFIGKKTSNIEKYPWTLFNSNDALKKLGPTLIRSLNKQLNIELFNRGEFRKSMTPSQFTQLFCKGDTDCGVCATKRADELMNVNHATLKSISSKCLSKLQNWTALDAGQAREVVPYLSNTAFSLVEKDLGEQVIKQLRSEQMEHFDESQKDDPCHHLNLSHVPERLARSIRTDCFANAQAQSPAFKPTPVFLRRANKKLLDKMELDNVETILVDGISWSSLSEEQIEQMIKRDPYVCHSLKAPPKGKPINLPLLPAECVKAIDSDELVKLLLSTSIKSFREDSLKELGSETKDLSTVLKPIATTRPELLKHLGADVEGDNACSQFDIQTIIKDHTTAAKLLPKNCFAAMTGIEEVTLEELPKLPEAAQEAVPIKGIIERMEGEGHFEKLNGSEWNKLMMSAPFCRAAPSEILHKNEKFVKNLCAPCYSALSFDLEEKEIHEIQPVIIAKASDDVVAKHIVKYTPSQISALSENVKKVNSLNALAIEQVAAVPVPAITHVTPNALTELDVAHLQAIPPEVFAYMTFEQLFRVPRSTIVNMTLDQARNLGKSVPDKTQDPHRLFTPDLHAKLSPELQKIIAVSSDANVVRNSVVSIAVAVIVALFFA